MAKLQITELTAAQRARMPEWAAEWIRIGLCTKPADRPRFIAAMQECYRAAKLEPPRTVVWVPNPLVGALAFPLAAGIIHEFRRRGIVPGDAVDGAVDGAVGGAVGVAVRGAVRGAVGGAVRGAVRDAVHGAVDGAVRGAVRGAVDGAVRGAVRDAVGDAMGDAVGDAVGGAVGDAVGDAVRDAVGDAMGDAVGGAVGGAMGDAVGDAVGGAVGDAVDGAVRGAVGDAVGGAVGNAGDLWLRMSLLIMGGQFWVGWWWGPAYATFFLDVCGLKLSQELLRAARANEEQCKSACWWWPHRDFVMVCERPHTIARDDGGRLHNTTGPAISWEGWALYFVHGVRMPAEVIEHPESLTVARIDGEQNAEVRRVMLDLYGLGRYVRDAKFEVLDADTDPLGQPRRLLRRDGLTVVELTNSTEDAGKQRRTYFVPVHPELRPLLPNGELGEPQKMTALAAVASSFGMRAEEYRLSAET